MWETKEVTITIRLPHGIADQVEEFHAAAPEYLERVVLQAAIRRGVYQQLRERAEGDEPNATSRLVAPNMTGGMVPFQGPLIDDEVLVLRSEDTLRGVKVRENRHHDGGAWADKDRDR